MMCGFLGPMAFYRTKAMFGGNTDGFGNWNVFPKIAKVC